MTSTCVAVAFLLATAAPEKSDARRRPKPVRKIDRAHVVGAPVLDDSARPGVYVWREDQRFQFAVVGRSRTTFHVMATRPPAALAGDGLTWTKKGSRHLVGRAVTGRGWLATPGHIKVGRARRGRRRVRIYVGPLARRAASTVEIGAFGAIKP